MSTIIDNNLALCNQALNLLGAESISSGGSSRNYTLCDRFFEDARDEVLASHPWNFARTRGYAVQTDDPQFGFDNAFYYPPKLPSGNDSDNPYPDCLRILKLQDWEDKYRVERDASGDLIILTDAGSTPDDWASGTDYVVGDAVYYDSKTYLCIANNTSTDDSDADTGHPDTGTNSWVEAASSEVSVLAIEYIAAVTDLTNIPALLKQAIVYALAVKLVPAITQDFKMSVNLHKMMFDLTRQAKTIDAFEGSPTEYETDTWRDARL